MWTNYKFQCLFSYLIKNIYIRNVNLRFTKWSIEKVNSSCKTKFKM